MSTTLGKGGQIKLTPGRLPSDRLAPPPGVDVGVGVGVGVDVDVGAGAGAGVGAADPLAVDPRALRADRPGWCSLTQRCNLLGRFSLASHGRGVREPRVPRLAPGEGRGRGGVAGLCLLHKRCDSPELAPIIVSRRWQGRHIEPLNSLVTKKARGHLAEASYPLGHASVGGGGDAPVEMSRRANVH